MPFSPTALKEARDAGYDDDSIYTHLASTDKRFSTAKQAGYSLDDVAAYLSPPDRSGVFEESTSERVMSGIAQSTAQAVAGVAKIAKDLNSISPINIAPAIESVQSFAEDVAANSAKSYGLDPLKDDKFSSKLISGAGSIVPIIASGPLAPLTAAGMMGQQGKEDAAKFGATEGQEQTSFYANAAMGLATEALLGLPAVMRFAKAAKVPDMAFKSIVGQAAKQALVGAGRESGQEAIQQAASNFIARDVAQYQKDRDIMEGVWQSAGIGALVGGPVAGIAFSANLPEAIRAQKETLSTISDTSLKAALQDEALLEDSPYSRRLIEEELLTRDPGYKAEEAGAPLTAEALRQPVTPVPKQKAEKVAYYSEGEVFTGTTHGDAFDKAAAKVGDSAVQLGTRGFLDQDGNFISSSVIEAEQELGDSVRDFGIESEQVKRAENKLAAAQKREDEINQTIKTKRGDKNETQSISDSTGTVENRDEQRQGQRQGDELAREGLRPDGGDTAADSSQREDGSPVDAGVRPQGEVATPELEAVQASSGSERSYDDVQKDIDTKTDELEAKGVNVFKLYDPTQPGTDILQGFEDWSPMPPELSQLYSEREQIGSGQLKQNISEISASLKETGLNDAEIIRVLDKYSLDPRKTDASKQYLAAKYSKQIAEGTSRERQAADVASALAAERGEMFDELKDISPKTLKDAANAVKKVREYFGIKEPEQSKLDELLLMVKRKELSEQARPASKTPVEAPKPSKQGLVLQKQLEELQGDLAEAKLAGEKGKVRDLKDQITAKKEAIAKEAQKTAPAPAAQKPQSKPQAESAPSQPGKGGGASSLQTISDVPALEARIGAILKQRKLSSNDAERTKLWNEAQELDKQIQKLKGPDFTQATAEPSPELTKEADETGTEFYSGIPLPRFKLRKFTPLDKATASRSAKLQKSEQEATAAVKEIRRVARTPEAQNAMTVYIEAGGNHSKLSKWHLAAKNKSFKKAALDAMRLTPEQEALSDKIIKTFETLGKRGQTHGVLKSFRDNYVPHVWDLGKRPSGSSGSALQQNFRHAKARTFATIAEGDAAGFTPKTLEIGKILPAYMAEMNKVIADRQFVHEMARGTASDGRPLVVPRGTVKTLETDDGTSYLVNPRTPTTVKDAEGEAIETRDYRTMENQPALAGWKWKGKDEDGNPIFLRADLALHPDAYRRVTAMLGKSAIREWAASPSSDSASPIPKALVRGLDSSQAVIKREMFSLLAPFHQVQEGTHAIGHLINPFFGLKEANLSDPAVRDAAAHGLMLQQDRGASQQYMEGIGGERSFTSRALGKLGAPGRFVAQEIIDGYQDYLFKSYIPRLKYTTYEAILKRNSKRYKNELASGEVTTGDIKLLSAEQTNAAYGHLNYALLDRNPTLQHLFQLGALAPDFLEARARFAGQAVKGLGGSKVGSEQLKAVVVLALVQAGIAYTLASLLGGEWDKDHPFEMRYKGRIYTMRSVPEDLMLLGTQLHDYGKGKTQGVPFVSARINPTLQTLEQLRTGLNFRGEKTDLKTTLGEYFAKYIPITARALPGVRELTETSRNSPVSPIQQMAGSFGIKISRYSPITDAYEMANKWKKENGIEEKQGTYPVSKYQPLRYALEDGDLEKAREKWNELRKKHSGHEIAKGFKASVTHAFTGSKENDRKLQQSLKPEDRAIFDEALRARQRILRSYVRMLESDSSK